MSHAPASKPATPLRLLAQTPGWFRVALTGALLSLVHQACALNPQPIPPDEFGVDGESRNQDAGTGGIGASSGGTAPPSSDGGADNSSSGGSSGGAEPAGDAGSENLDAGDADAGEPDAGDAGGPDAGEDAGHDAGDEG